MLSRFRALPLATFWLALTLGGCSGGDDHRLETGSPDLGVFVLVVDGFRPSEVGLLTPNLSAFRDQGRGGRRAGPS